jgi:hypothetical protein
MRNKILLIYFVLISGCSQYKKGSNSLAIPPPPPPPPNLVPPNPAPNFVPKFNKLYNIQINSIPHPFDIDGNFPYVVWLDGERVNLSFNESANLVKILKTKKPTRSANNIRSTNGWQRPYVLNDE